MEKVRPWCGQPSDRGRLMNRTEQSSDSATIGRNDSPIVTIVLTLFTYRDGLPALKTIIHPETNRNRRRAALLTGTNALYHSATRVD